MRISMRSLINGIMLCLLSSCQIGGFPPQVPQQPTPAPSPEAMSALRADPTRVLNSSSDPLGDPRMVLEAIVTSINHHDRTVIAEQWDGVGKANLVQLMARFARVDYIAANIQEARIGAAAGTRYAQIPTALIIAYTDGSHEAVTGCVVLSGQDSSESVTSADQHWQIDSSLSTIALFTLPDEMSRYKPIGSACWLQVGS